MKFRWYDAVIILAILALTGILAYFIYANPSRGERKFMVIERANVEIYRLDLATVVDEVRITIEGEETKMVIGADKDGCWVISSGCPDHVCIDTGKIIDSGDLPIICMPNEVSIRVVYE